MGSQVNKLLIVHILYNKKYLIMSYNIRK